MRRLVRGAAATLFLSTTIALPAGAAELHSDRFYAGAGPGYNEVGNDDAIGIQFFGGYRLPARLGQAEPAIEIGYWDSGDLEVDTPSGTRDASADGLWVNGVARLPLDGPLSLLGRIGADFGDDDGLMAGGGVGVALGERLSLRGEVVVRDETDSLQGNLVYWF